MIIRYILKSIINFFKIIIHKKQKLIIENNVSTSGAKFSMHNRICKNSHVDYSSFGDCTYISWNCILRNVSVGAFVSIGPYVEVIYGTHPTDFISTHPIFYSTRKQCGISFTDKQLLEDFNYVKNTKKSAIIGNDVWIGYGAKIIEGVTVHDGAIILAGAIVTKDVEEYSIVGGVPAKHIKFRFTSEQIEMFKSFKWWEKDFEWIKENAEKFVDISTFVNIMKKELR